MTYENASEADVLKSLWRPGAPLENTLFALLDPNGRALTRGTRSPGWIFRDAAAMAQGMNDLARQYPGHGVLHGLPVVDTVRLGLNVAACDKLPLAIVVGEGRELIALEDKLAQLSWRTDLVGALTYTAGSRRDLSSITLVSTSSSIGDAAISSVSSSARSSMRSSISNSISSSLASSENTFVSSGYLFVVPNQFGTTATVVAQLSANASTSDLERAMRETIARNRPQFVDHHEHIRLGHSQGISWKSALPVTDPATLFHDQMERRRGGLPPFP